MNTASFLVTGGAGYIGSHTVVEMLQADLDLVILDNLSNSSPKVIDRIERITGKRPTLVEGDIRDSRGVADVIRKYGVTSVVHFAGLKAVGESVTMPIRYYDNNVVGTLRLIEAMVETDVRKIVFSSSATVYGEPRSVPISEGFPLSATNPYGRTKLMIEEVLRDVVKSDPSWRVALLRYFNPVGAHPSGLIGEDPRGVPNNLLPYIAQVAVGRLSELSVFGNDYPTSDGTGVRDYIHVVDLARGHLAALEALERTNGVLAANLGTGRGYSVLEMVEAFQNASGKHVPYRIAPRRPGDIAACFADPSLAQELLGWRAELDLDAMCQDAWRWQSMNPAGYGS